MDVSKPAASKGNAGFTLPEVIMAVVITAVAFGGIIMAYTQSARRAQWSGYSLAAQALAIQQIEVTRSCVWDMAIGKNDITNLPLINKTFSAGTVRGYTTNYLDLPTTGTNYVRATNYITLTQIQIAVGAPVQLIRVDTVWPFTWGKTNRLFTNTICTYIAPDNRDNTTF